MSFEEKLDFGVMYRNLKDFIKEYNQYLYEEQHAGNVPKWMKDLLIFLLMKSKEKPCPVKTKFLRKMVINELNRELENPYPFKDFFLSHEQRQFEHPLKD